MRKLLLKKIVRFLLRLHSWSYKWAGHLSAKLEPDRLHPKHRLMKYHDYFMENVSKNEIVLDIGCGVGALALDVATRCRKVIGIDFNEKSIKRARKTADSQKRSNIEFIVGDATNHIFNDKPDCVILSNVLEHVEERVDLLKKLSNISPKLLIRVPMITREWIAMYKKELGLDYRLDPTHFTEYTMEEFEKELASANLKMTQHQVQFGELWCTCLPINGGGDHRS